MDNEVTIGEALETIGDTLDILDRTYHQVNKVKNTVVDYVMRELIKIKNVLKKLPKDRMLGVKEYREIGTTNVTIDEKLMAAVLEYLNTQQKEESVKENIMDGFAENIWKILPRSEEDAMDIFTIYYGAVNNDLICENEDGFDALSCKIVEMREKNQIKFTVEKNGTYKYYT